MTLSISFKMDLSQALTVTGAVVHGDEELLSDLESEGSGDEVSAESFAPAGAPAQGGPAGVVLFFY